MRNKKWILSITLFFSVLIGFICMEMNTVKAYDDGTSLYDEERYDYRTRRNVVVDFNGGNASLSYKVNVDRNSKNGIKQGMWIEGLGIGTLVKDIKGEYHYLRSWSNNQQPTSGSYWMEIDTIGVTPYLCFSDLVKTGYTYDGMSVTLSNGKKWKGSTQDLKNGVWGFGIGAKASGWSMSMKEGSALKKWLKDNPDIHFKIQWKANTYTIKYNGNGQSGGYMANSLHTYDQKKNLSLNGYYKKGYSFVGWSTSPNGIVVYEDKESIFNLTDQNNKTIELFAVWEKEDCTNTIKHVVYDSNNHYLHALGNTTFKVKRNTTFTLNDSKSTRIPKGFSLSPHIKDVTNNVTKTLPQTYTQNLDSMMFEFYYVPKEYKINYVLNGGINSTSNPSTYTILDGFTLSSPTKKGCEFLGWYYNNKKITSINQKDITQIESSQDVYALSDSRMYGDITLQAKWSVPKPVIDTKVGYYYKDEIVTREDVLKNADAYDSYDGDISHKVNIEYYKYPDGHKEYNSSILDTSSSGCVYVMYTVTNSHNQTVKKEGTLIIVDKESNTLETSSISKIYTRFVGMKKCVDGTYPLNTLDARSIWKNNDYYNIILSSLSKSGDEYLKIYDYVNQRSYVNKLKN